MKIKRTRATELLLFQLKTIFETRTHDDGSPMRTVKTVHSFIYASLSYFLVCIRNSHMRRLTIRLREGKYREKKVQAQDDDDDLELWKLNLSETRQRKFINFLVCCFFCSRGEMRWRKLRNILVVTSSIIFDMSFFIFFCVFHLILIRHGPAKVFFLKYFLTISTLEKMQKLFKRCSYMMKTEISTLTFQQSEKKTDSTWQQKAENPTNT